MIPTPPQPPSLLATPDRRLPATGPVRVFISYAPEDEALCEQLQKHLKIHQRKGFIESWASRAVGAGGDWRGAVDERLQAAHVILLLLSDDYLASDYCFDVEMDAARRRHEAGEAVVVPVLLRPVDVFDQSGKNVDAARLPWFERLTALPRTPDPKNRKYPRYMPVTVWPQLDSALAQVVIEIREMVEWQRNPRR
jgi:hypothetical protein